MPITTLNVLFNLTKSLKPRVIQLSTIYPKEKQFLQFAMLEFVSILYIHSDIVVAECFFFFLLLLQW